MLRSERRKVGKLWEILLLSKNAHITVESSEGSMSIERSFCLAGSKAGAITGDAFLLICEIEEA